MSEARTAGEPRKPGLLGRHVLMMMLSFFGVIVAVDSFMIYRAVSTFGGLETQDAYKKGLAYNQRISRDAEQARAGWKDTVEVGGAPPHLRIALRDHAEAAVAGKRLVAKVGRPATDRFDMTIDLAETVGGVYEAALPAVAEGSWIVELSAYDGAAEEPAYEARRRVWIGH
jgi:nitrogen fixation protein FixH